MSILTKKENKLIELFGALGVDLKPSSSRNRVEFYGTNFKNSDEVCVVFEVYGFIPFNTPEYSHDTIHSVELIIERRGDIDDTVKLFRESWDPQEIIDFYKKSL